MAHIRKLAIHDEASCIWQRAEEIAENTPISLGQLVTQALHNYLSQIEQHRDDIGLDPRTDPETSLDTGVDTGVDDIAVEVGCGAIRWDTVFRGRWIIEPDDANRWSPRHDAAFGVAHDRGNALIFYHYHLTDAWAPSLILYSDLTAAAIDLDLDEQAVALIAQRISQRSAPGELPRAATGTSIPDTRNCPAERVE